MNQQDEKELRLYALGAQIAGCLGGEGELRLYLEHIYFGEYGLALSLGWHAVAANGEPIWEDTATEMVALRDLMDVEPKSHWPDLPLKPRLAL